MIRDRRQAPDQRVDHAVRELRPVHEEVVEDDLVEPERERGLEGGHGGGARLGDERSELPDRRARPELHQRLLPAVHAHSTLDHRIEMRFHGTFPDEDVAGGGPDLGRGLCDGCEDATWHAGEDVDAMESGHALDETERIVHAVHRKRAPGVFRPDRPH